MKNKASIGLLILALVASLALAGCAADPATQNQAMKGAALGAGLGGLAGALINDSNRWQGGVIGAAIGAAMAGGTAYIAAQASSQAAHAQKPVAYNQYQSKRRVEAYPVARKGDCTMVREKYYEHGKLVKEVERQVCN